MLAILEHIAIGGPAVMAGFGCICWCFPELVSKSVPKLTEEEINTHPISGLKIEKTVYRLDDLLHS